jgi:hypothetical protein
VAHRGRHGGASAGEVNNCGDYWRLSKNCRRRQRNTPAGPRGHDENQAQEGTKQRCGNA